MENLDNNTTNASIPAPTPTDAAALEKYKNPKDGTYSCPECGKSGFKALTGLGSHRKANHGVQGTSSSSLDFARKQAQRNGTPLTSFAGGAVTLVCPDCDKPGFRDLRALNTHRAITHKVPGKTNSASRKPLINNETNTPIHGIESSSVSQQPDLAINTRRVGRPKGTKNQTKETVQTNATTTAITPTAASSGVEPSQNNKISRRNKTQGRSFQEVGQTGQTTRGATIESEQEANAALITFAVGRIEAQCHQLALENELPAKKFTRWVATYFQLQAMR
jgi:hypothetical protein